jgi:hypothetical protein
LTATALASGGVDRTPLSFPIRLMYLRFGFLICPLGLGIIELGSHDPTLEEVATLTLALVLFLDTVNLQVDELVKLWLIPFLRRWRQLSGSVRRRPGGGAVEPVPLTVLPGLWGVLGGNVPPEHAGGRELLRWVQGHLGIENQVHLVQDVDWDDDRRQVRTGRPRRSWPAAAIWLSPCYGGSGVAILLPPCKPTLVGPTAPSIWCLQEASGDEKAGGYSPESGCGERRDG